MQPDEKMLRFEYVSSGDGFGEYPNSTSITKTLRYDDATTWDVVLRDFVLFLSHCWGYDISDQVRFKDFNERLAALKEDLDDEEEELPGDYKV
jgi:hypothetical protein